VNLNSSTVSSNTAATVGGGIHNACNGTTTLDASSVVNNTAKGGPGSGGGIYDGSGTVSLLDSSSITGNTPDNCSPENTILGCSG
jgi:hypothetical protein